MRFSFVIIAMIVMVAAAACSGDSGEQRQLPTSMALPTLADQEINGDASQVEQQPTEEPTATPEPTEEAPPATEAVEVVFPPVANPEATEDVAVLPFAQPQTVGNTEAVLPPFARPGAAVLDLWSVSSQQPVSAFACADTTCEVITVFQPGDTVEVIKTGEEWVTGIFEGQEVFVSIAFLEPIGPLTAGNQLPPGVSGDTASSPFGGSGGTGNNSLPPFAQGGSGGSAPPFAQNTGGGSTVPGGPTPIPIPPAGS